MLGRFWKSWLAVLAAAPAVPTSGSSTPATSTPESALTTTKRPRRTRTPTAPAACGRAMRSHITCRSGQIHAWVAVRSRRDGRSPGVHVTPEWVTLSVTGVTEEYKSDSRGSVHSPFGPLGIEPFGPVAPYVLFRTFRHMAWINDWAARAACRVSDPDTLFVQGAAQNRAKLSAWAVRCVRSASPTPSTTASSSASGAA